MRENKLSGACVEESREEGDFKDGESSEMGDDTGGKADAPVANNGGKASGESFSGGILGCRIWRCGLRHGEKGGVSVVDDV